jgi:hypothetical protein
MVILLELWVAGATARTRHANRLRPDFILSRGRACPGADYVTQILGIEQTVTGRGVSILKIAGFWSREKGVDHD